jgi:myo-inositol 2-dehydrogenase/D-chiro-inositol 1-dehydrogenase
MQDAFDNSTEIIGTKGVLKINQHLGSNPIDVHGVVMADYYGRYECVLFNKRNSFAASVLDSHPLPYQLSSAVKRTEIAQALHVVTGQNISLCKQREPENSQNPL